MFSIHVQIFTNLKDIIIKLQVLFFSFQRHKKRTSYIKCKNYTATILVYFRVLHTYIKPHQPRETIKLRVHISHIFTSSGCPEKF